MHLTLQQRSFWGRPPLFVVVAGATIRIDSSYPDYTWRWVDGSEWHVVYVGLNVWRNQELIATGWPINGPHLRWSYWRGVTWQAGATTFSALLRGSCAVELRSDSARCAVIRWRGRKSAYTMAICRRRIEPPMAIAFCLPLVWGDSGGS